MASPQRAARRAIKLLTVVLPSRSPHGKRFGKFAERPACPISLPKDAA
jgi:hypothetical protein